MLYIMRDFPPKLLKTFTFRFVACQTCKLLKKLFELTILLKVFELLQLCLVDYVTLEVLEVLVDALLNQSLVSTLRLDHSHCLSIITQLRVGALWRTSLWLQNLLLAFVNVVSLLIDEILEHVHLVALLDFLDHSCGLAHTNKALGGLSDFLRVHDGSQGQ